MFPLGLMCASSTSSGVRNTWWSRVVLSAQNRARGPTLPSWTRQGTERPHTGSGAPQARNKRKRMQTVIFLAFALGVMLSPDTLILLGNTLGREGYAALSGLLIAGSLHVLTARTYGRLGLHPTASVGESRNLVDAGGPLVATVLPLCARVVYTVAAATGILAIAGYVFNEVLYTGSRIWDFRFASLGWWLGSAWQVRAWPR